MAPSHRAARRIGALFGQTPPTQIGTRGCCTTILHLDVPSILARTLRSTNPSSMTIGASSGIYRPSALSGSTQISQPATLSEQLTPIRVSKEGRPLVFERTEHGHVVRSCRLASADLFGQGDDDARGAAEVAEPEDALVLRHLAEEFGAVGAQAGDGVVDVVDGEHDTMQAQRVG